MSEWRLFPATAPKPWEVWESLRRKGHVPVLTLLPRFVALCREELGWDLVCVIRESPPGVVPVVIGRRSGPLVVRAESLPQGFVGGALLDHVPQPRECHDLAQALSSLAHEVLVYPGEGGLTLPGWEKVDFTTHEAHLAGGRFNPTRACRSAARHAERLGVTLTRVDSSDGVSQVFSLHERQQRARGARVYPRRWLERLVTEMPESIGLWGAFLDGRILGALLVGWTGERATAVLSTSDPEARPLKAGNLLYVEVLHSLAAQGVRVVDLGGSRGNPSLEAFKASLGAQRVARPYYRHRSAWLRVYQRLLARGD